MALVALRGAVLSLLASLAKNPDELVNAIINGIEAKRAALGI